MLPALLLHSNRFRRSSFVHRTPSHPTCPASSNPRSASVRRPLPRSLPWPALLDPLAPGCKTQPLAHITQRTFHSAQSRPRPSCPTEPRTCRRIQSASPSSSTGSTTGNTSGIRISKDRSWDTGKRNRRGTSLSTSGLCPRRTPAPRCTQAWCTAAFLQPACPARRPPLVPALHSPYLAAIPATLTPPAPQFV